MKEIEIIEIEKSLGLTIPDDLKSIWINYPLKAATGNSDQYIWDNSEAIIAENQTLRSKNNWPESLFFIGRDEAGNDFALKKDSNDLLVGVEFGDPKRIFDPYLQYEVQKKDLSGWFSVIIKEMVEEGYDIETGEMKTAILPAILVTCLGIFAIVLFFTLFIFLNKLLDKIIG